MKRTSVLIFIIVLAFGAKFHLQAQQKVISIWPSKAPGTETRIDNERNENGRIYNVYQPDLEVFLPDKQNGKKSAVLIFPGGGYTHITLLKEGEKVAAWLNSLGVAAYVLKYRLNPDEALQDAERALSLIRSKAEELNIDSEKIGIIGFSAGGHLALNLANSFLNPKKEVNDEIDIVSCKPDFMILVYPYADSSTCYSCISKDTPPAFIVHAADDHRVPVQSTIELFNSLRNANVPVELHIFETGGHGFGMGKDDEPVSEWPVLCRNWMLSQRIISE